MRNFASIVLLLLLTQSFLAQTQTTGALLGTVRDPTGALVKGATVTVVNATTNESRTMVTNESGVFAAPFLSPGVFRVRVEAAGFNPFFADSISISLADTTEVDVTLTVAGVRVDPVIVDATEPLLKAENSTLGRTIDSRAITEIPLPTRSFTQLLGVVPGTGAYLNDPTAVGRNTQAVSVNGSRPTQNNFQINGVDANAGIMRDLQFGDPSPESIAELRVQTSTYDATFGRAGGGSIQVVTKSGSNDFHGNVYGYFGNAALNANDPFLKAAGQRRPVLSRNVYGGTLGGHLHRDSVFFFASFQGSRERNAASRANSLRTGILIDPRLTDDRSAAALATSFPGVTIHPVSLSLLQARLPDRRFVIPSPPAGGFINFAEISTFKEEQFNANLDLKVNKDNWLSLKLFYSKTPTYLAFVQSNIPGFGETRDRENAIASLQNIHTFSTNVTNEARLGYNYIHDDADPSTPLTDAAVGITRSTATAFPGLTRITIGQFTLGAPQRTDRTTAPSASFTDTVSVRRGQHMIRIGGEVRYYEFNSNAATFAHGWIAFQTFNEFLSGIVVPNRAVIGSGIVGRSLRTTDHAFFIQDDWRLRTKLTLNLGLRYELAPPFYDTRGRLTTFDPALYVPRMELFNGQPAGPPIGGLVQAGNAIPAYDHSGIANVGKRLLRSIDPNNFGPRVGLAYSPFGSDRVVLRAGYGIFYSRASFQYAILAGFGPPVYRYVVSTEPRQIADPFPAVPSPSEFPGIFPGGLLTNVTSIDRNMRTPYIQQFNAGLQFKLGRDTVLETAYVGTRGLNLFRQFAINQAYLASQERPIRNVVTGTNVTTNTPDDAQLRAPYQGVAVGTAFSQNQSVAQSSYHSLQTSLSRRWAGGLQFLASYTYSKSIDTASGNGGGSGVAGTLAPDFINDTSFPDGDQRNSRSSRGVSDFDRTHRFVFSNVWEIPRPAFTNGWKVGRMMFSGWHVSGTLTWMSGLPINIRDARGAELFFGGNGGGDRPNWAPGATVATAMSNVPRGYSFNPFAFVRAVVHAGHPIPSSSGHAVAGPNCPIIGSTVCTDFGNVGRNPLRGPRQFNIDLALSKRFQLRESRSFELRAEAFNLLNNVNFANPISNFNAAISGGSINNNTGQIIEAGNFGKIISTSNNPRIVQLAVKFCF
jgi:hypothetical protein